MFRTQVESGAAKRTAKLKPFKICESEMPCLNDFSSLPHLNYAPGMVPDVPIKCSSNCRAFLVLYNLVKKLKDNSNVKVAVLVSSDNIQLRPLKSAKRRSSTNILNNCRSKKPRTSNVTNEKAHVSKPNVMIPRLISQLDDHDKNCENQMLQKNGKVKPTPTKVYIPLNGRTPEMHNNNINKANIVSRSNLGKNNKNEVPQSTTDLLAKLGLPAPSHSHQSLKDLLLQRKENDRRQNLPTKNGLNSSNFNIANTQVKEIFSRTSLTNGLQNGVSSTLNSVSEVQKQTPTPNLMKQLQKTVSSAPNLAEDSQSDSSVSILLHESQKETSSTSNQTKQQEQASTPSPMKEVQKETFSAPNLVTNQSEIGTTTPVKLNGQHTELPVVILDSDDDDDNVFDSPPKALTHPITNNSAVQNSSLNETGQDGVISSNQSMSENIVANHPKISELLNIPSTIANIDQPIFHDEIGIFSFHELIKEDCELIEFKNANLTRTLYYYQSGFPCPDTLVGPALCSYQKNIKGLRLSLKSATVKLAQFSLHPHKSDDLLGMLRFKFKHYGKPTLKFIQLCLWTPTDCFTESQKYKLPGVSEEEELEHPVTLKESKFYFVMVRMYLDCNVIHLPPIAVNFSLDSLLMVSLGRKKDQNQQH